MKNVFVLSLSLGFTCLLAGLVLTWANDLTAEPRERARLAERFAVMRAVFPECVFSEETAPARVSTEYGDFAFFPARQQDGQLVGFAAFGQSDQGYGGGVRVMVGLEIDPAAVRQVAVVEHSETPGLGTRVTERREPRRLADLWRSEPSAPEPEQQRLPPNQYLDQFAERPVPEQDTFFRLIPADETIRQPRTEVQAVSGATVSSQAVVDAVNRTLKAYRQHQAEILGQANQAGFTRRNSDK